MRLLAAETAEHIGQEIEVRGWIHRIRDMGQIRFAVLRDRSGFVQLVFQASDAAAPASEDSGSEAASSAGAGSLGADLGLEYVVAARGTVVANEKSPGGAEIEVTSMDILSRAAADIPFPINRDPREMGIESILDNRILSLRNPQIRSIFELQSSMLGYVSRYMHAQGFREMKTSKLIGSGTEGGTGLFSVDYFDRKVYLAQSPQFYKQAMISTGLERVFEISHAYRAEKHDTPRHLNEYVSFDVEMAFIESEHDLMNFERGILADLFEQLSTHESAILSQWDSDVPKPELCAKIPVLSCDEVKSIVSRIAEHPVYDITPEAERIICEWAQAEHGIAACFINDWPRRSRPFYTHPKGPRTTMSFDLIFRGLEITTGGRRINEYQMLLDALPRFGMTEAGLGDYPLIFKYGCPPHGGFAIGIERLTQKILGLANVKEASPFPRDRKRVTP